MVTDWWVVVDRGAISRWKCWSSLRPGSVEMLRFDISASEAPDSVSLSWAINKDSFSPFPGCLIRESTDGGGGAVEGWGLLLGGRGVTLDGGGIFKEEEWGLCTGSLRSLLGWIAESAGDCRRGTSFLMPLLTCAERSAEALLVLSCDRLLGRPGPEPVGPERGIPLTLIAPWPLAPALTRSCCRLRASLSTDTPPPAFWPPNRRVILGLVSGDRADNRSFTLGCEGSATTRFASARRRLK